MMKSTHRSGVVLYCKVGGAGGAATRELGGSGEFRVEARRFRWSQRANESLERQRPPHDTTGSVWT